MITRQPNPVQHTPRRASTVLCLGVLIAIILCLATKGMLNENNISMNGDMPRHLMNGALILDFFRELPIADPLRFAYNYYATYPALSLGFHPPLLPLVEAPVFAILGVSVFSGRVVMVAFLLLGVIAWFKLIQLVYDQKMALLSSLLLATNPYLIAQTRIVMTDIPALAMIILSAYLLILYCTTERRLHGFFFLLAFVLTVLARPQALFMLLVFLAYLALNDRRKPFLSAVTSPLVLLTGMVIVVSIALFIGFGTHNVGWLTKGGILKHLSMKNLTYPLKCLGSFHIAVSALVMALVSLLFALKRKDRRILLFLLWIMGCYIQAVYIGPSESRYSLYWIPPFCLLAALITATNDIRINIATITIILFISGNQFSHAMAMDPQTNVGYYETARYLIEGVTDKNVLYSSSSDTGYLWFFTRSLDPDRKTIIFRADKILATANFNRIVEERITTKEELYTTLKELGIEYVVIDGKEFNSRSLNLLRDEMTSDKFRLLKNIKLQGKRFPIGSVISIYQFTEHTPPKQGIQLHMALPIVNHTITVSLDELMANRRSQKTDRPDNREKPLY